MPRNAAYLSITVTGCRFVSQRGVLHSAAFTGPTPSMLPSRDHPWTSRGPARHTFLTALLVALAMTSVSAQTFEHLRLVVPAPPGGGWDLNARAMQPALQGAGVAASTSVENVPGAGGTVGLAHFVSAERGKADVLMVSGLSMLGAIVLFESPLTLADVTPIARLVSEYEVVIVPASSPIRSMPDLIRALRTAPESVSWGGSGGPEQILAWLIAEAVGVEASRVNFVSFAGQGETIPAIMGGQVSVAFSPLAAAAAQIDAGSVRVLGVSSADRVETLDAPTLREHGIDVELENWKILVAPPGISRDEQDHLEQATAAMARSKTWRDALERYRWTDRLLMGPSLHEFLDQEEARWRTMVRKFGAGTTAASQRTDWYALGVLVGLASLLLTFLVTARRAGEPFMERAGAGWTAVLGLAVGVIVDVALIDRLGFVIASSALFWLTARAFDVRHPIRDGVVGLALSLGAYILFAHFLDLSLPAGVLDGLI